LIGALPMKKKINISIIVLDTLRLDAFNKIVKENPGMIKNFNAVRFEKCISPGSWTLPSHASMFTGMDQSEHGCHETKEIKSLDIERIRLREPTILDELKREGYTTYGISANPYVNPVYGFTGFDTYMEESYFTDIFGSVIEVSGSLKKRLSKYRNTYGNDVIALSKVIMWDDPKFFFDLVMSAAALSPRAAVKKVRAKLIEGWPIEKGGKKILQTVRRTKMRKPFFLFVNFMEAHDPYIGKKGMDINWAVPFLKEQPSRATVKKWERLYEKASRRAMRYGTELMNQLTERFGEDQIIILTSDHGQAFNEHGFVGHGTVIFDEVVEVPLLVMVPKSFSKSTKKAGYQSLVNIREFIRAAVAGDIDAISKLTTPSVIAETFSIPANISNAKGLDKRRIAKFDKYQKRVFK
jgi:Sulfatase